MLKISNLRDVLKNIWLFVPSWACIHLKTQEKITERESAEPQVKQRLEWSCKQNSCVWRKWSLMAPFQLQLLWCDSSKIQEELNIAGFLHYNRECAIFWFYNYPDTKIPVPVSHFSSVPSEQNITALHAVVLYLTETIMTTGLQIFAVPQNTTIFV